MYQLRDVFANGLGDNGSIPGWVIPKTQEMVVDTSLINTQDDKVRGGCPRGVMVKALDCGIVVSEFELQSRYYVHFRTNTLGKVMSPLIPRAVG